MRREEWVGGREGGGMSLEDANGVDAEAYEGRETRRGEKWRGEEQCRGERRGEEERGEEARREQSRADETRRDGGSVDERRRAGRRGAEQKERLPVHPPLPSLCPPPRLLHQPPFRLLPERITPRALHARLPLLPATRSIRTAGRSHLQSGPTGRGGGAVGGGGRLLLWIDPGHLA